MGAQGGFRIAQRERPIDSAPPRDEPCSRELPELPENRHPDGNQDPCLSAGAAKAGADTPAGQPGARQQIPSDVANAQAWFLTFVRMTMVWSGRLEAYTTVILGPPQAEPGISGGCRRFRRSRTGAARRPGWRARRRPSLAPTKVGASAADKESGSRGSHFRGNEGDLSLRIELMTDVDRPGIPGELAPPSPLRGTSPGGGRVGITPAP